MTMTHKMIALPDWLEAHILGMRVATNVPQINGDPARGDEGATEDWCEVPAGHLGTVTWVTQGGIGLILGVLWDLDLGNERVHRSEPDNDCMTYHEARDGSFDDLTPAPNARS
jgi:hypothetical protein